MNYLVLILALVFVVPAAWAEKGEMKAHMKAKHEKMKAHHMEQKAENKAFRGTLKEKSKEEKIKALKAHHHEQKIENKEFRQKTHEAMKAEHQKIKAEVNAEVEPVK